jgi:hypothetical protein
VTISKQLDSDRRAAYVPEERSVNRCCFASLRILVKIHTQKPSGTLPVNIKGGQQRRRTPPSPANGATPSHRRRAARVWVSPARPDGCSSRRSRPGRSLAPLALAAARGRGVCAQKDASTAARGCERGPAGPCGGWSGRRKGSAALCGRRNGHDRALLVLKANPQGAGRHKKRTADQTKGRDRRLRGPRSQAPGSRIQAGCFEQHYALRPRAGLVRVLARAPGS